MSNHNELAEDLFQWAESQRGKAGAPPGTERLSRHPLSKAFGDLPPKAREALIAKVKQSGAVREIPTLDGHVLLDWDPYNIALDLGLTVRLEEFSGGDPLAFIIVNCLDHTPWDKGQRAVIAVRLHAWRERGRPGKSVLSTDLTPSESEPQSKTRVPASTAKIADSTQVSPTFITQAKRVEEFGLGEVVISGELKLAEAYRRAKLVLDAGLGDTVRDNRQDFEATHLKARLVADAGFIKRVRAGNLTFDDAYRKVLAGETEEAQPGRSHPPTKAEMAKRVEELERENRRLADRAEATEARAAAAEAQVKRLTAMLESAPAAA